MSLFDYSAWGVLLKVRPSAEVPWSRKTLPIDAYSSSKCVKRLQRERKWNMSRGWTVHLVKYDYIAFIIAYCSLWLVWQKCSLKLNNWSLSTITLGKNLWNIDQSCMPVTGTYQILFIKIPFLIVYQYWCTSGIQIIINPLTLEVPVEN